MNEWLLGQLGKPVIVHYGVFQFEGELQKEHEQWRVNWCEFVKEEISNYGHDQNGQPYVTLCYEVRSKK